MRFKDRATAGQKLATRLQWYREQVPLVMALSRGGLPVGAEVARALGGNLEVLVVRRLGESDPTLGAVAEGGALYVDLDTARAGAMRAGQLAALAERESDEVERKAQLYRAGRPLEEVRGRTVIIVDDGVVSGSTARAAIRALREGDPGKLILAVPVISEHALAELRSEVDEVTFLAEWSGPGAVAEWYEEYPEVTDAQIVDLLAAAALAAEPPATAPKRVVIHCNGDALEGLLAVPASPHGLVIFAHGAGGSRFSRSGQQLSAELRRAGFATLLFDLSTPQERAHDELYALSVQAERGARRLVAAARVCASRLDTRGLPIGFLGVNTGAPAALLAAGGLPDLVRAVVTRGGRPEMAGLVGLSRVHAPTLLIAGSDDREGLERNREALARLTCEARIVTVPGASRTFEEPGALEVAAGFALQWFARWLPQPVQESLPLSAR